MAGYDRNYSSSEEEDPKDTTTNLRELFRKNRSAPERKDTARGQHEPSDKRSSKHRGRSPDDMRDDHYKSKRPNDSQRQRQHANMSRKTSSKSSPERTSPHVKGKSRHKDEPEKALTDDFMEIFRRSTIEESPVTAGFRNRPSSQRSSSDDSEEDEGKASVTKGKSHSTSSSGTQKYLSRVQDEPYPEDPFLRLQARRKGNDQNKGRDKHGQSMSYYDNKESFSESSRSSLSDISDDNAQDNPFKKLVAPYKDKKYRKPPSMRYSRGKTKSSSSDENDKHTQSGNEDNPFMKLVADVQIPKDKPVRRGNVHSSTPKSAYKSSPIKKVENSTSGNAGAFATSKPAVSKERIFEDSPRIENSAHGEFGTTKPAFSTERMFGDINRLTNIAQGEFTTSKPAPSTRNMFEDIPRMANSTQGNFATTNPAFSTDRMFDDINPMANGGLGDFARSNPAVSTDRMFEHIPPMANGTQGEFSTSTPSEATAKMFEEIRRLVQTTQGKEPIPILTAMIEADKREDERTPPTIEQLMSRPRGEVEEFPDDDTGISDAKPSVRRAEMEREAREGKLSTKHLFRPLHLGNRSGNPVFDDESGLAMVDTRNLQELLGSNLRGGLGGIGGASGDQLHSPFGYQRQEGTGTGGAPSNPIRSLFGAQNQGGAGTGGAPSNPIHPLFGAQNQGGAGTGGAPSNPIRPLFGAQNQGGSGGQNSMAQMQMLQQMLGGQGGQDPMAQLNMLQQMMGGQGGDMMNMLGQAGLGRGRGMGMPRESSQNIGNDNEEINIENMSDNDIIHQMLEWEARRAHNNKSPKAQNGTTTLIIVDTSGSMAGDAMLQAEEFLSTFMDGLQHLQNNLSLQENVAVITVGSSVEVTQHLTNNYSKIREALHCLCADGPSKLQLGLILPISIVGQIENGGIKDFGGHVAAPRVILVSDGRITGQPDGPNPPDEREKMGLQNAAIELVNTMVQTTLAQVFCVPVGNADRAFLEFISSTTGGKTFDRKYARQLSRYHIYHTVVTTLKQQVQTEPTRESIQNQLVTVAHQYDEADVEEVLYLWRQPEPDIQGLNERRAQQEEDTNRRKQGGTPANNRQGFNYGKNDVLPGSQFMPIGRGRGGGVPGLGGFGGQDPGMGGLPQSFGPSGRGLGRFPPVGGGQETGLGGYGMGYRDVGGGGDFEGLGRSGGSAIQSSQFGSSRLTTLAGDDFGMSQRRRRHEEELARERDEQPKLPPEQLRLEKLPGQGHSYWPSRGQLRPSERLGETQPAKVAVPDQNKPDSFTGWRIKHNKDLKQFEDENPSDSATSDDD